MNKILDENVYDLIIDNIMLPSYDTGDNTTFINQIISLLHVVNNNMSVCDLGRQPYHRFPALFTLESDISIEKSRINRVQTNPYLGLYGSGVIVGIIDTGIDYQHPVFCHNDGTTRILSIWDQSVQEGNIPDDFTFGSEYTYKQINLALQSDNPLSIVPSVDAIGHGTAIASIVAGKEDIGKAFRGVAPDSELVVVKLKEAKKNLRKIFFVPEDAVCYQESDILLALRYLMMVSKKLNRPLAICLALGTSQGGHDGRGNTSVYLDYVGQVSRVGASVSAGNEGNTQRHYYGQTDTPSIDEVFELRVDDKDKEFSLEIWPDVLARLAIEIITPTGESTQWIYPQRNACIENDFIYSPSNIWVNNIMLEEKTGNQLILIRFKGAIQGIWQFRLRNIGNEPYSFHAWLPSGHLISRDTYFLNANPDTTITEPGNAKNTLTVAAYNQNTDAILLESSRGYTRTDLVKPNLAAPGYNLTCALPNNQFGTLMGTGAAAAHTAGIIAMILEWAVVQGNYTSITGNDINNLLIRGARRKPTMVYPNNIWGYGEVDAYALFERLTI
ncbi:S8 family peptidase [Anaerosporobacter sp.]|uniref:S8 family peptidase n=1 Tax=Anaerosporobacter sp. TaxID=1872529 RepID=UPI00286EE1D8|nr:S8 family peptidase [Anaerosporobacter sp.]